MSDVKGWMQTRREKGVAQGQLVMNVLFGLDTLACARGSGSGSGAIRPQQSRGVLSRYICRYTSLPYKVRRWS